MGLICYSRGKAGRHDTTVDETVAPAVTKEVVNKTLHEQVTGAVDREVHQDHYHTSVQPIQDRQILPETHEHRAVPVEHREHIHNDSAAVKARLEQEAARFRNERIEGQTQHTHSEAPVIAGEHRHHHVHEVIQPVVEREVIQPHVVHTVVPVHEVHHNAAKHHAASTLPAMSMSEFKAQGGALSGREARHDGFEGEPRAVASATGASTTGTHHHQHHAGTGTTSNTAGSDYDNTSTGGNVHKPTLGEKLNPKIDADGDGKAGIMS